MTTEVVHEAIVPAPARRLFDLVADVVEAPRYFATHLYAEIVRTESPELDLVARWVIDNGSARGWRLWRTRDTEALVIGFQHEIPRPPLTRMLGRWSFESLPEGGTRIRVAHSFDLAPGTDPAAAGKVRQQLDGNVPGQLANIGELAERIELLRRNTVTSTRSVRVDAPLAALATHTAGSVADDERWTRLQLPDSSLVFKQHAGHDPYLHSSTGVFRLAEEGDGTTVRLTRTDTIAGPATADEIGTARKRLDAEVGELLADCARLGPRAASTG
ncbi:aromatase/cyclase [Streptomyces sp. NPDC013161]|uniref:aromatase/cyclase n=1 Tax=Streptomyces sp. NPDC013161 TaxID=3364862 RepID=UPI00368B68E2